MTLALLRNANLSQDRIDSEAGVIYGVRIAEVGKLARFTNQKGKVTSFDVTPAHVDALLAHAGNRTLPVHWTHDYKNDGRNALHATVGGIKNFRKDETGHLIADFQVAPTQYRDQIFWGAANLPNGMMMSAVFGYSKDDPTCMPKSFMAADLVEDGAATTALLSAHLSETDMNEDLISQLQEACKDPTKKADLLALLANDSLAMTEQDATAMMSAAGVTDADKKEDEKDKPPIMRAMLSVSRSIQRHIGELKNAKKEIIDEAKLAAAAVVTKTIGKGVGHNIAGAKDAEDGEAFITAQLSNGCPNRATAVARMAKDKKELYDAYCATR